MSTGDNGFVLICAAFVFFMTPGLAFFYGGLVRRKNIVNTIMACVGIMGLSVVMWIVCGFSLSFGADHGGIIGGLEYICLNGLDFNEALSYAPTLSSLTYVVFQMMFAMITPALITGAVAGRMRYKALFLFIALWSLVVYYPMAHMVWGAGGLLAEMGAVDFAGGNVVHISSGVSVWSWRSFSAGAAVWNTHPIVSTTFRLCFWARRFFGLAGLDSMPALRSVQTALPRMHF